MGCSISYGCCAGVMLDVAGAVWDVTSSMWSFAACMHVAHALIGLSHALCGLSLAKTGNEDKERRWGTKTRKQCKWITKIIHKYILNNPMLTYLSDSDITLVRKIIESCSNSQFSLARSISVVLFP